MGIGILLATLTFLPATALADRDPHKGNLCISDWYSFRKDHPHWDVSGFNVIDTSMPQSQGFHPTNFIVIYRSHGKWVTYRSPDPPLFSSLPPEWKGHSRLLEEFSPYLVHDTDYGPCPGAWQLYFGPRIPAEWCGKNPSPAPKCISDANAFINNRAIAQSQLMMQELDKARAKTKTKAKSEAQAQQQASAPTEQAASDPACFVDASGFYRCVTSGVDYVWAAPVATPPDVSTAGATAKVGVAAPAATVSRPASITYSIGRPPPGAPSD